MVNLINAKTGFGISANSKVDLLKSIQYSLLKKFIKIACHFNLNYTNKFFHKLVLGECGSI